MTDYERIGGEAGLRRIVERFVDRFFEDFIIGFLFAGKDRDRIVAHELSLAGRHLGGGHVYEGRPMGAVHRPLKINKGQFRRRMAILRHVLHEEGVPDDVIERWLAHDRALERAITIDADCVE